MPGREVRPSVDAAAHRRSPAAGVRVVPLLRKGDPRPEDHLPEAPARSRHPTNAAARGFSRARWSGPLRERIEAAEQAILFLNRRGHSTVVRCGDCGWVARCPHCDISLTWHADRKELRCHYCAYRSRGVDNCPDCAGLTFVFQGDRHAEGGGGDREARAGGAPRPDGFRHHPAGGGSLEAIIESFSGTAGPTSSSAPRWCARGLDFPGVTLVGVDQCRHAAQPSRLPQAPSAPSSSSPR
jgi:hypothetical protein